jgi:Tol biopolymer transport system component
MNRFFSLSAMLLVLSFGLGCGGGSGLRQPNQVKLTISPISASPLVNQTTQFTASVTGTSDVAVTWSVQEANGGTVTGGLYHAPWANGTYHVTATSVADPSKSATATVSVSAMFAFLEELPNGQSLPYSLTPVLGTFAPDGRFSRATINDPATGQPMDTNIDWISLSPDGKKVVFDRGTYAGGSWAWNIYSANADFSGLAQLTHNQPGSGVADSEPVFSANGKQIAFIESSGKSSIMVMNADGSNPHSVLGSPQAAWVNDPSFSPDGTMIVAEVEQQINGVYYEGIASMNSLDGSNLTQLTNCYPCNTNWHEMPTFTSDGKQVAFSGASPGANGQIYESTYIMNLDGTGLTKLYGDNNTFISCQPRAVADKLVFSTNVDFPGSDAFEMYSVMPDGSSITRLTNSGLYDGFSLVWWGYNAGYTSAQNQIPNSIQNRLRQHQMLNERLGLR